MEVESGQPCTYALYAAIYHHGRSTDGGHSFSSATRLLGDGRSTTVYRNPYATFDENSGRLLLTFVNTTNCSRTDACFDRSWLLLPRRPSLPSPSLSLSLAVWRYGSAATSSSARGRGGHKAAPPVFPESCDTR